MPRNLHLPLVIFLFEIYGMDGVLKFILHTIHGMRLLATSRKAHDLYEAAVFGDVQRF